MEFPPTPRKDRRERLQRKLLDWYGEHRRDLPWRRTQDPYAIWISEAMLQQTRVATVIDYWRRFLAEFPTVESLASASEESVLAQWSGLGYYSRARSLHAAASAIVERHAGNFPRTRTEAMALPGVGEYTAGAVLSIAFGLPEALVDGNVERVISRVLGLPGIAGSPQLRKHVWALAALWVGDLSGGSCGPGAWNQALMELGATVCTSARPDCEACPWNRSCRARASGDPKAFPEPKKRRVAQDLLLETLWACDEDRVLLVQRPTSGAMAGMWELPTRRSGASPTSPLWNSEWPSEARPKVGQCVMEVKHAITHHKILAKVFQGKIRGKPRAGYRWFTAVELEGLPRTGLTKKALTQLGFAAGTTRKPRATS